MGDTNQDDKNTNETADNAPAKKKDWTAADLVKVTEYTDENDNGKEVSNEKLDSLISGPQASKKAVNIRKEDVQMIMEELELPKIIAEKKLIEHNGDVIAATRDLMGF
ncbi:unnamed protein product [Dracunculus medinensis]|uniref:HYPK_UBA domain-containing protein n=1 Tax=Dracunculus medinensis TaxID=318479 RepID=A0A0N4UAM8_DRAME|nr:unnamed protein product [Dracunculus medinensis]